MYKKIAYLVMTLSFVVLVSLGLSSGTNATSNEVPSPVYKLPKVVNVGDKVVGEIDNLSFESSANGIKNFYYSVNIGGTFNNSAQFDSIVVPKLTGGNDDLKNISVRLMGSTDTAYDLFAEVEFDGSTDKLVLTREDILNAAGKIPTVLDIHISSDGPDKPMGDQFLKYLNQTQPILVNYTVLDNQQLYRDTDYFQSYGWEYSWYTNSVSNRTGDSGYIYPYFETMNIELTSDKTKDLKPGDEVELTMTNKNDSSYVNYKLYNSLEVDGLTPVANSSTNIPESSWFEEDGSFNAKLFKDNKWLRINGNDELVLTRKFKINDDFKGNEIVVKPFTYSDEDPTDKRAGASLKLNIVQPAAKEKFYVKYNLNGGSLVKNAVVEANYDKDTIITILSSDNIKRDNYIFKGWNTKKDGSGKSYKPSQTVKLTTNLDLYAVWEKKDKNTGGTSTEAKPGNNSTDKNKKSPLSFPTTGSNDIVIVLSIVGVLIIGSGILFFTKERE